VGALYMKKKQNKIYVVRKYITAPTARDAIKKEKNFEVDEVFLHDDWQRENPLVSSNEAKIKGFNCK
jgi:hypothetical protein